MGFKTMSVDFKASTLSQHASPPLPPLHTEKKHQNTAEFATSFVQPWI